MSRATRRGRPRHPDALAPAEWRGVHALRHGMSNQTIARRLHLSRDAVQFHVHNALAKLGSRARAELKHWQGGPNQQRAVRKGADDEW